MKRPQPTAFALAAALALLGCDALPGPGTPTVEAPAPPPPADPLEARLRELGRERAAFMVLDEAALRGEGAQGDLRDYSHVMHPGWCYKVLGLGGEGVVDLDLRVYDPNDVLLQRDTTRDAEPQIGQMRPICPGVSGTYRIQVRLVEGGGPFVVQVYRSI
ncbi:MAG: hypothetical protein KF729_01245 [Sandaracinaceae bacterium]|nr:hypothetical protein [Sandaracinaceae bacterium]